MANQKVDGVIEAVHYKPDGQVDWVRAYLRRGATWSDRVILSRQELINQIQAGAHVAIGSRVQFMAGTFDIAAPVRVAGSAGKEVLVTSNAVSESDHLEGAPLL